MGIHKHENYRNGIIDVERIFLVVSGLDAIQMELIGTFYYVMLK
jgi:hypothetical protein